MGTLVVNLKNVPSELHYLIPLARYFGIPDDYAREAKVKSASPEMLEQLREAILKHNDVLDAWLAGLEASGPNFSDEYVMFSAMRMAADYAA
jgi:hypothetical protein